MKAQAEWPRRLTAREVWRLTPEIPGLVSGAASGSVPEAERRPP